MRPVPARNAAWDALCGSVFTVSAKQLRQWREVYAGQGVVEPGSIPTELEVKQLRRELSILREERDILKKALAIFSDRPR